MSPSLSLTYPPVYFLRADVVGEVLTASVSGEARFGTFGWCTSAIGVKCVFLLSFCHICRRYRSLLSLNLNLSSSVQYQLDDVWDCDQRGCSVL